MVEYINREKRLGFFEEDPTIVNRLKEIRKKLTRNEQRESYYPNERKTSSSRSLLYPRIIGMVFVMHLEA